MLAFGHWRCSRLTLQVICSWGSLAQPTHAHGASGQLAAPFSMRSPSCFKGRGFLFQWAQHLRQGLHKLCPFKKRKTPCGRGEVCLALQAGFMRPLFVSFIRFSRQFLSPCCVPVIEMRKTEPGWWPGAHRQLSWGEHRTAEMLEAAVQTRAQRELCGRGRTRSGQS